MVRNRGCMRIFFAVGIVEPVCSLCSACVSLLAVTHYSHYSRWFLRSASWRRVLRGSPGWQEATSARQTPSTRTSQSLPNRLFWTQMSRRYLGLLRLMQPQPKSFYLKQQTSVCVCVCIVNSYHPPTYWNVNWRTFLFQTNSDVCAILGPCRKTFIFIKSRAGQFGKPHSDISVLIIAATLRLQPSLFQRRSRLCATLGGIEVNIWFKCQIRFACEAARPHSPLSLRNRLI